MTWKKLAEIILAQPEKLQNTPAQVNAWVHGGNHVITLENLYESEHDQCINMWAKIVNSELPTKLNQGNNDSALEYYLSADNTYCVNAQMIHYAFGINVLINEKRLIKNLLKNNFSNQRIYRYIKDRI